MRIKLFAVFVLLLFSVSSASAWTDTGGGDHGGANWTPDGDTIAGVHTNINIFTISNGATATINAASPLEVYAQNITVLGTLDGNGKGYAAAAGAGAGGYGSYDGGYGGGGGAGYGGAGGDGSRGNPGAGHAAVGSISSKTLIMGSGGGNAESNGVGGKGGGAVQFFAELILIDGIITMDGALGTYVNSGPGGGGSGGGILLCGSNITLSGTLSADGAAGTRYSTTSDGSGGGGGGRIKVFYYTAYNNATETVTVTGGAKPVANPEPGENGTYYIEQLSNTAPTTPTITAPLNDTIQSDNPLALVANSTDSEGDYLTYHYYGDTTDGDTYLGFSSNGTYHWIPTYNEYNYWKVRAADLDSSSANTSVYQFYYIPTPTLQIPVNASVQTLPYPPLLNEIDFAWESTGATAYKYQIATDSDFNLIYLEDVITSNTTTQSMQIDTYYWRVAAYSTVVEDYSDWSSTWEFSINETNGGAAVTAIDGVVYEVTTAGSVAVDGALVNIWNTTWSDSMLVGQNGYYYFDGAKDGTYSVKATKTGYTDSSVESVTVLALNTTTRNILLQDYTGAGREYVTHYVLFTVKTLWGTLYSGVDVNVYLSDAVIALYTGTTGTDGSVGFELVESNQYRLTFIDASQGIDEEITIYPTKSEYPVYIIKSLLPDDEDIEVEDVVVSIATAEINDTHAYINVTYTDAMAETTDLNIFINQSDESDPFNQTIIQQANLGATSSVTQSFLISNYAGQAYFVNIGATHTTFDSITRTYSVRFDGMAEDYGFSRIWVWVGGGGLMLLGGMFKASKAEKGALIVCAAGWIFMAMGLFDALGSNAVNGMKAGLGLATLLAIGVNMVKKDREETV